MSSTMVDTILRLGVLWVLAASVGIGVIAVLRPLVRRYIGARGVLLLWWILPVALLAVALPKNVEVVLPDEPVMAWDGGGSRTPATAADAPAVAVAASPSTSARKVDWRLIILAVWLCGAVVLAVRFALAYRHFLRTVDWQSGKHGTLPAETVPAVIGVFRPRIALPIDFRSRYNAAERRLILLHEVVHQRRGDGLANFAMAMLRVLMWFNPLVHWAGRALGDDQEAACDATVIARHPGAVRTYADALLRSDAQVSPLPLVCHWQAYHPTVKRIAMLKGHVAGRYRARLSRVVLVLGGLISVASVYAIQPGREILVAPAAVEVKWSPVEALPFLQPANRLRMDRLPASTSVPQRTEKQEPEASAPAVTAGDTKLPEASSGLTLNTNAPAMIEVARVGAPGTDGSSDVSYYLANTISVDGTTISSPVGVVRSGRPLLIEQGGMPNVPNFRLRLTPSATDDGRIRLGFEFTIAEGDPAGVNTSQPQPFSFLLVPGERATMTMRKNNRASIGWTAVAWPIPRFVQMPDGTGKERKVTLSEAFRCQNSRDSQLSAMLRMLGDDVRIIEFHRAEDRTLRVVGTAPSNARVSLLMRELSASSEFEKANLLEVRRTEGQRSDFQIEFALRCGDASTGEDQQDGTPGRLMQLLQSGSSMSVDLRSVRLSTVLEAIATVQTVQFTSQITGAQPLPNPQVSLRKHDVPKGPLLGAVLQCSGLWLVADGGENTRRYFVVPRGTASALTLQDCVDAVLPDGPTKAGSPSAS